MSDPQQQLERLTKANRRWKWACGATAAALLLGVGMAMQAGLDTGAHNGGSGVVEAAVPVHDSTGFAVFARPDGNVVIIKEDGTVIRTQNQPLSVSF